MRRAISSRVARTASSGWPFGSGEFPVQVALAGDVRAGVAAAHRHDDVGAFRELAGEPLWAAVGEVDAELAHDVDDLGMHAAVRVGDAARGLGGVAAGGGAFEEGLADLGAAGVVQADEQHVAHGRHRIPLTNVTSIDSRR